MDFIMGFSKVKGIDTILVVIDRLSKYRHFLMIQHPFTTKNVTELFIREIVHFYGFPHLMVTDQDNSFMSHLWKKLFKVVGFSLKLSSMYHPKINRQTKVVK